MTEPAISPLRRRMIEDMTVRNFSEKTRTDYIRHIKTVTAFLGAHPTRRRPRICAAFNCIRRRAVRARRA